MSAPLSMFCGLSAFPLTPADAEGRLQPDALAALIERLCAAGVDSIGLLGSTGGYPYLTREVRREAVRVAVEVAGGRAPVIVGVGALRTDAAQALARDAEAEGASGVLLAPVSYQPLTEAEVAQLVESVAGASGLPLCLYNNPRTTGFTFSEALVAQLSHLPRVAAVKMPSGVPDLPQQIARLRASCAEGFAIGYSGDAGAPEVLLSGADGWFSVIGGLLPAPALRLARLAAAGEVEAAKALSDELAPLSGLVQEFGGFRVMYAAARIKGLAVCDPPRPVLPLPAEVLPRLEAALAQAPAC
ncbi:dihydrodipicolinate synthase family protein [Pseudoroseicyclus aestuarii]|uniref:4-hydroxy-tetrahydrodipicolinate synthase n=1 Tax=Pseudoroseicyclus aestuarii TaxID=1795041 RepID=A0A318T276_9RHOB|nr:dihydrodipicolinate synthase family protein [Pseudoroseicyclus aestuarii]PYE84314.1 4-hydroxy-tetrahydrodipicolinate synthase [Pseudoroseicyclus aestuarii]